MLANRRGAKRNAHADADADADAPLKEEKITPTRARILKTYKKNTTTKLKRNLYET